MKRLREVKPKLVEVVEPSENETRLSRAELQRKSAKDSSFVDVIGAINGVIDKMYSTDVSEVHPLTSGEVHVLTDELLAVRRAKDVVEGREKALKEFAIGVINRNIAEAGNNPEKTSGCLVSADHKVKLSKEVSGGKLTVDVNELRKLVDEDVFFSVVNITTTKITTIIPGGGNKVEETTVYEINEECLENQVLAQNIGMEQILKASIPGPTRSSFFVRDI